MDNREMNIATQVLIKGAVELVSSGKYKTLDEATTDLVVQYEKVLKTLKGEALPKEKIETKPVLESTPIPKNESTRTYDDVKADAKSQKSYQTAFAKLETIKDKEGIDDLMGKVDKSEILTKEMKESLKALILRKEEEILKAIVG